MLEQSNDRLSGLIQHITITARRGFLGFRRGLFLGCKLPDLLGYVGGARAQRLAPTSDPPSVRRMASLVVADVLGTKFNHVFGR